MPVFDTHTHFFSRAFYEYQASQVAGGNVTTLLERLGRHDVDVPGEDIIAHRDRIIADLDDNGVDRAVTFASVPGEMEIVGEAALHSGGRLVPYTVVNPTVPETIHGLDTLQPRYGFRGMLLFPAMHDYRIGDDAVTPALDLARRHGMIVFVHCGALRLPVRAVLGLEPEFPLHNSHPGDVIPVAQSRSDQTFVVPHFGAGFFDEFLRLGQACPNVYADTAGSNTWGMFQAPPLYLEDLFEQTLSTFGVQRILFGSDTGGFPRGYRRDVFDAQTRAMHDAGISASDQTLIFGDNLAKLLEL